ncbi:helix-turn-helix transcriptional regulator [Adhaeribacter aquaticus]|uniref:helix-turn-helix transcriptional regulator n=1 Tax=Adhaeribacter aquaticus TaxID=299567 RepID=UPI00041AD525|nr:helix-turn-helix domain-containing protein [Adhaeribacter aquaticus]
MELIVTTTEQLSQIIREEIRKAFSSKPQPEQLPDRCTLEEAKAITGFSESKIYKLTSAKQIPCKHFGNRLVFSRKELLAWVESQTISSDVSGEATLQLAKSARRKSLNGAGGKRGRV